MTEAVRDRILKDVNGNVSDHQHNHIHLTNCIHLKNHVHYRHSSILADKALMRDLVVLQRSRSLRDPSASPHSWHSPIVDELYKGGEREALYNARQSVGDELPIMEFGKESRISPPVTTLPESGAATVQFSRHNGGAAAATNLRIENMIHECRRAKREESDERSLEKDITGGHDDCPQLGNVMVSDSVFESSNLRDRSVKTKSGHRQDRHLETLSDQVKDVTAECEDGASSRNIDNVRQRRDEKKAEHVRGSCHRHGNSINRVKRFRFRGSRKNQSYIAAGEVQSESKNSMASIPRGRDSQKYHVVETGQEYDTGKIIPGAPKDSISWNYSSIHLRGKSFSDMAGRSLSCALTDARLEKGSSNSQERDISHMPAISECPSSSTKSDGEALPLLLDSSGSQGNVDNSVWEHDYSGDLGIFANNLLKQEICFNFASRNRSPEKHKSRRQNRNGMHQNLTQRYMPRTFRDLVGQNLVARALSNVVVKQKVGSLYVFYGSHGTGKTSCARIFARALNCQSLKHSKPCGFCSSCSAHDMGENRNIMEIGPVSNIDLEGIIDVLDNMISSQPQSRYRVFIFDECDTFSSDCWKEILKFIVRAPRHVVFVLVCSSFDVLPHIIISRCQKFFFPKLKDSDIIYTLQSIATKEELDTDMDALKLIASRSDGSLRDAEMTLEQLSLLGHRISVCLVQELIGLISDEKLVDLLDIALSADTVNTVKNLRHIMESGIEPLALMSQLATLITDILAGSYDFLKGRPTRKFFHRQELTKEDMEKLRQALKTLSEAEKQLRASNDRITWLTAALLQLAPDQQYMLHSSSSRTSFNHGPLSSKEKRGKIDTDVLAAQVGNSGNVYCNAKLKGIISDVTGRIKDRVPRQVYTATNGKDNIYEVQFHGKVRQEIEVIWLEVLEKIPIHSIKELMYRNGKLISLSYGAAPTVQLLFNSQLAKSKAEKFIPHIIQAFETVLRSSVTIKIICDSKDDVRPGQISLPTSQDPPHLDTNLNLLTSSGISIPQNNGVLKLRGEDKLSAGVGTTQTLEIEAFPRRLTSQKTTNTSSFPDHMKRGNSKPSLSLVRRKVSLAHVFRHAEVCSRNSGWSKGKGISIAEKLERQNLKLESRSRRLFCWNPPRVSHRKLSRLRVRKRGPDALLKLVSCGRCFSGRSSMLNTR
ncbi:protein STICHEL-like 4 [Primulina huaijiensis]|uniref:protein STICHEL-like 4 n=1 Tax=Primulina huaijiensis TaxID=1492673 RepID=UPI003CC766DA